MIAHSEMRNPISTKTEAIVLREICEYLSLMKVFFWRSNNIPVFGMSNDGKMRFRALPKYTPKGLPDIIIVHEGKFIGIEVKKPGAKLRPEQEDFKKNVVANDGLYFVVDSMLVMENVYKYYLDSSE